MRYITAIEDEATCSCCVWTGLGGDAGSWSIGGNFALVDEGSGKAPDIVDRALDVAIGENLGPFVQKDRVLKAIKGTTIGCNMGAVKVTCKSGKVLGLDKDVDEVDVVKRNAGGVALLGFDDWG